VLYHARFSSMSNEVRHVRLWIVALLALVAAPAFAQADGGTPAPAPAPAATPAPAAAPAAPEAPAAAAPAPSTPADLEAKLDAARREVKELREEMRAQFATQSIAQGWQEDWVEEKRKLELLTLNGYLRVRPELFYKYDMGRGTDTAGYTLVPRSPTSAAERTQAGVNMRFRLEPTLNVSEEVRIRAQIDALDNLVWGSTPDYAYSRNAPGYYYDRNDFSLLSETQAPPRSGINSLQDSVSVKRVWGEVSTPVGILRFGRMGSHWGLGMLHNDGNGIDNDWGDTVDRLMFVAEPISGIYVTPMFDFNVEGALSTRMPEGGQPFDLSNGDDAHGVTIAFTYRWQQNDAVDLLSNPLFSDGGTPTGPNGTTVQRKGTLLTPDVWAKLERKEFRIELEAAAIIGNIQNRALSGATANTVGSTQSLDIWQFGAVLQGEYRFLNGDLEVGGEVGFASGDKAPGFGNYPRRKGSGNSGTTAPGDTDGPQYACFSTGACTDNVIRNFRFNQDYRADTILYREILGGITDSFYVRPRISYRITQGFNLFGSALYARAIYAESTPSAAFQPSADLGIEATVGARYETEDGFFAMLQWGIFVPWGGFAKENPAAPGTPLPLDNPQVLRGMLGIKF